MDNAETTMDNVGTIMSAWDIQCQEMGDMWRQEHEPGSEYLNKAKEATSVSAQCKEMFELFNAAELLQ